MWWAIAFVSVMFMAFVFGVYVVHRTGSTKGLADVGKMVADIVRAFIGKG
jgi:hypothetical protein